MTAELIGQADTCDRRYYSWRATHPDADVDLEAWRQAWKLGGRDALLRSGELAGLVPRLEELIHLYQSQELD